MVDANDDKESPPQPPKVRIRRNRGCCCGRCGCCCFCRCCCCCCCCCFCCCCIIGTTLCMNHWYHTGTRTVTTLGPHWDHMSTQFGITLLMFLWANCLCHLWWHRQLLHKDINNGPRKHQRPTQLLLRRLLRLLESDCCGSLNVDMVVVWAVVVVFVSQLSVPPQVAQTVGPQKHQQRPTKTAAHSMLTL